MIINLIHGFCMALADSVPGVSGGTIAFVLGFYERFIESLRNVFTSDKEKRTAALFYLCKLGLGWIIGLGGSVFLLSALFERNIYFMSSLFLGLSFASLPLILRSEKNVVKGKYQYLFLTALGFVLVAGITLLRDNSISVSSFNFHALNMSQLAYLFLSGLVAITAMVVPGISGSTLLLIFGVYLPLINALHNLMEFDFTVFPGILATILGALTSIVFSVRFIRAAFRKYRCQCIYLIVGLIAGSLVAITYGATTLEIPKEPLSLSTFEWTGFLLGILILICLEAIPKIGQKKKEHQ